MPAAAAGAYGDAVDYGVVATQSNYGVATQLKSLVATQVNYCVVQTRFCWALASS